ncbi:hypothetical protein QQ045_029402 [Rhodiola kirilowii]
MASPSDIQRKSQEMNNFVQVQNERLRLQVREKTKRQTIELLQNLNHQATELLQHKDAQIQLANQKTMELQANINRAQSDLDAWKIRADSGKAIAHNLRKASNRAARRQQMLQSQARLNPQLDNNNSNVAGAEAEAVAVAEVESVGSNTVAALSARFACKVCGQRESCMVMVPCCHLCCCKACVDFVSLCPVCGREVIKGSALEASMK